MSAIHELHKAQERRHAKRARNSRPRRKVVEYTDEEKAEIRADHAAKLDEALAAVADIEGAAEWLRSRALNEGRSPANIALIAYFAPGEVALTFYEARSIGCRPKKGQRAQFRISGKTGWPVAVWTASELNGPECADRSAWDDPAPEDALRLAKTVDLAYREFGRSVKSFRAAVEAAGFGDEETA